MSLGSLPVIKNLVSRSRRERVPLTPEMISPPLGDFRHTMHVGRKGEVFGDTSFLTHCHEKHRHTRWNYITKKLRQARWMSPESQSLGHQVCPPPPISPIIKNAVSLPLLNKRNWDEETDGTPGMAWNSMSESCCQDGLESGFCTMPRLSSSEDPSEDTSFQKPDADWASSGLADTEESSVCTFSLEPSSSLCHSDSMQSLVMDFGPSLMTEILEGINFSDTPKKPEGTSVLHQESVLSTNNNPAKFEVTLDKSEAHQFQCDTQEFQCDTQEPKSLVSWEPTTIAEEMEIDTDSGITGSEQGSRGITGDLWDSGDGSEIEM